MKFGIDRVNEYRQLLTGRVALLTSPTGRTADNRPGMEVLRACCDLRLLLGPEHGVRGDRPAGYLYGDSIDEESGLPVVSLYTGASKHLSPETLARFDTLVYDIQDVGVRYYTFISTLRNVMQDCAAAGKRVVVLDRPDPLGSAVEGPALQPGYRSFVGCMELPVRYGMTCGEFALMANDLERIGCDLQVIPCDGLTGDMRFPDWGLPWVMPSLGLPRWENALLYPGTCLIEGTNCSEGRGTGDPFMIIGAPYIRAEAFCRAFNGLGCPGITATPVYFTPTASKHQGTVCGGIHLHVMDSAAVRPVAMGLRLLDLLRRMYPGDFAFLPPAAAGERPFISLLMGCGDMQDPAWGLEDLLHRADTDAAAFRQLRRPYMLYGED